MEKTILKTLIYADIFDYPLKLYEIHKWLIGKKVDLRQVEKALKKLLQKRLIKNTGGYYFLPGRAGLTRKRKIRTLQSSKFFFKVKIITQVLQIIPQIKLVGISGGLAMENADKKDDIDLILITAKKRIWLTRLLVCGFLDLIRARRTVKMKNSEVSGKLCVNILIEEDRLEQESQDIYLAHEILQMRPLWIRDNIYDKYLQENDWVFKFLPNWIGPQVKKSKSFTFKQFKLLNLLESYAKQLQLKIMKKPVGAERIDENALYFHPQDCRPRIIKIYQERIKKLSKP